MQWNKAVFIENSFYSPSTALVALKSNSVIPYMCDYWFTVLHCPLEPYRQGSQEPGSLTENGCKGRHEYSTLGAAGVSFETHRLRYS